MHSNDAFPELIGETTVIMHYFDSLLTEEETTLPTKNTVREKCKI